MSFARKTHINLAHLLETTNCPYNPRFGMRVLEYEGIAYGPPSTPELLEAVREFPLDRCDVLVSGYPKSGTNWMQIMLANFWDDWGHHKLTGSRRVPSIDFIGEGTDGYDIAVSSTPPRLMKNHLPAHRMPHSWPSSGAKVVYMTRNPFDVCASFYRQLQIPALELDQDWDAWVDRFIRGDTMWGGWPNHVRNWHAYGEAHNVHHLSYEALSRDPVVEMRKVVAFLGKPLVDGRFDEVVTNAMRENMDKSGYSEQITVSEDTLKYYRGEGKVGAARAQFSPDQVRRMEEEVIAPLRAAGLSIEN